MEPNELTSRLGQARQVADFVSETESVVQDLVSSHAGLEAVTVILKFMEENPQLDFGTPGPLVHFAEGFYGSGYEKELLASLSRKPIPHTVWMLNRVINGTKEPSERKQLIEVLRDVERHSEANSEVRSLAASFLSE